MTAIVIGACTRRIPHHEQPPQIAQAVKFAANTNAQISS